MYFTTWGGKDLYNHSCLHMPLQQRYYKNNSSERNVELVKCLQKYLNISYFVCVINKCRTTNIAGKFRCISYLSGEKKSIVQTLWNLFIMIWRKHKTETQNTCIALFFKYILWHSSFIFNPKHVNSNESVI